MQNDKTVKILNSHEVSIFTLSLASKTFSKKIDEVIEFLHSYYPYDVEKENLIIKKNKVRKNYICCVLKSKIDDDVILLALYAKNHFKNFTGYIHFCIDEATEVVQMNNGNIEKVFYADSINSFDDKNVVKVFKDEIYKNCKSNDIIRKNEKKFKQRKIFATVFIFIFLILFFVLYFRNHFNNLQLEIENKKQMQEIEKQNDELKVKNEKKLVDLQKEYTEFCKKQFDNIYNYICILYSCIEKGSVIENLSIDKNSFSVDVTTSDALKILSRFEEKVNIINEIKMNRTVVQGQKESVSFSGKFIKNILSPNEDCSVEEKICFYQEKINEMQNKLDAMKKVSVSEYAKNIREKLHFYSCVEQYIQYRTDNNIAILECLIASSSSNILKFLENIQKENNSEKNFNIEIIGLRLRNSQTQNNVQTTILFWTGIEHKENFSNVFIINEITHKEVSEVNSVFYKTPLIKKQNSTVRINKNIQNSKISSELKIIKSKNLQYVGTTKVNGKNFIIIKNLEMTNLYKLPLLDNENIFKNANYDCCVYTSSGKLNICIKGNVYEVQE